MAVTYDQLMALQQRGLEVAYAERDTMLYALSVGAAAAGIDEAALPFVYEGRPMRTLPSMATVLMRAQVPASGLDFRGLLHGEQRLALHRAIPSRGPLVVDAGVSQVIDKGPDKGLVVLFESKAYTPAGEPVFTATAVMLARLDGGIGAPAGSLPAPRAMPERQPDLCCEIPTRPDQALLYRLNEDLNPLHVDPKVATAAGFPAPILHGLCTYGLVCAALVRTVCGGDPARMASYDVRFASPVFPGETLLLEAWGDGSMVAFRCRVPSRDRTVLDNGSCELRTAA